MASVNVFVAVGRIVRDVQPREVKPGLTIATCTLAIDTASRKKDGTVNKETCFIDCTVFGQAAIDAIALKKGVEVFVKGRLKLEEWDDKKTGEKKRKHVIIADTLIHNFSLDSQAIDVENAFEPVAKQQQKAPIVNPRIQQKPVEEDSFEDLPF